MFGRLLGTTVAVALSFGASAGAAAERDIEDIKAMVEQPAGGMKDQGSVIILASDRIDPSEGPDPQSSGIDPKEGPDPEAADADSKE